MINRILKKYNGFSNSWFLEIKEPNLYFSDDLEKLKESCRVIESKLLQKYKNYIPKGWYGFCLGPVPVDWFNIIEEYLDYLINLEKDGRIKNFEIQQIKLKYGGLRFYVSYETIEPELDELIKLQIEKLENHCFDKKLVY